jgi:hypothetical protein
MQTQHRSSVCLLYTSTDLPIWSGLETVGTLYQKDQDQFHLVLTEPVVHDRPCPEADKEVLTRSAIVTPRLLWLELSPYRITMTMQGNGQFSYRHFWERGVYGTSRYWLHSDAADQSGQLCLRNFTRNLQVDGHPLPQFVRVEYELWSGNVQMGHYVVNLDIHHPV